MRAARPKLSGWLLDPAGNGGARGMIIASPTLLASGGGEQNPAYGPLQIPFFTSGALIALETAPAAAGAGFTPARTFLRIEGPVCPTPTPSYPPEGAGFAWD